MRKVICSILVASMVFSAGVMGVAAQEMPDANQVAIQSGEIELHEKDGSEYEKFQEAVRTRGSGSDQSVPDGSGQVTPDALRNYSGSTTCRIPQIIGTYNAKVSWTASLNYSTGSNQIGTLSSCRMYCNTNGVTMEYFDYDYDVIDGGRTGALYLTWDLSDDNGTYSYEEYIELYTDGEWSYV